MLFAIDLDSVFILPNFTDSVLPYCDCCAWGFSTIKESYFHVEVEDLNFGHTYFNRLKAALVLSILTVMSCPVASVVSIMLPRYSVTPSSSQIVWLSRCFRHDLCLLPVDSQSELFSPELKSLLYLSVLLGERVISEIKILEPFCLLPLISLITQSIVSKHRNAYRGVMCCCTKVY